MTDYYFEKLNHHVLSIDANEKKLRQLWAKYLDANPTPDFVQWCVFLAQNRIQFFYYEKNPNKYITV